MTSRLLSTAGIAASALSTLVACGDDDTISADTSTTSEPAVTTTSDGPTESTTTSTTAAPATSTTAAAGEPALAGAASPIEAVFGYLDALGAADYAGGWALLHPDSRTSFPNGWQGYDGETGLVEGAGAYSAISQDRYQAAVFEQTVQGEQAAVVSLWGEIEQEGETNFSAFAFGARTIDGLWYAELVSSASIVFISPAQPGATIEPADGVVATYNPGDAILETVAVISGTERDTSVTQDEGDPETARIEVGSFDTGSQQVAIGLLLTTGDLVVNASYFAV